MTERGRENGRDTVTETKIEKGVNLMLLSHLNLLQVVKVADVALIHVLLGHRLLPWLCRNISLWVDVLQDLPGEVKHSLQRPTEKLLTMSMSQLQ